MGTKGKTYFKLPLAIMPTYRGSEALLLGYLLSRWEVELRFRESDTDIKSVKPIDSNWIRVVQKTIHKKLRCIEPQRICTILKKWETSKLIERKKVHTKDGKQPKSYIRFLNKLSKDMSFSFRETVKDAEDVEDGDDYRKDGERNLHRIFGKFLQIYYDVSDMIGDSNAVILYHWILNQNKVKMNGVDLSSWKLREYLGIKHKKTQRICLNMLKTMGLLDSKVRKIKRNTEIKSRRTAKITPQTDKPQKGGHLHKCTPRELHKCTPYKDSYKDTQLQAVESDGFNLFSEKTPDTDLNYDNYVTILRNSVIKSSHLRKSVSWSRKSWNKEFHILDRQLGTNNDLIKPTLDWYVRHRDQKFVPVCDSAKSFRLKFDRIVDAMNRIGDQAIEPSPEALEICKGLLMWRWPDAAKQNLPRAVESSLRGFIEWKRKLKIIINNPANSQSSFHNKVAGSFSSNPITFLTRWFADIFKRRTYNESWNGEFRKDDLFSIDNPLFQNLGNRLSMEYSGRSKLWNELMDLIDETP